MRKRLLIAVAAVAAPLPASAQVSPARDNIDALIEAAELRFRPILMTTMAALLGALPLMLGSGMGSELRQPLGITMVGGLLVSQVLTLFTTPVIYLGFDTLARRYGRRNDVPPGLASEPDVLEEPRA